ncbi:AIPR family protein [Lutibacter flavus]|uniref:AIPR protein n=1 Tax=Lutibacter flavus TaxID=691689 RepID=A0A238XIS7_9FLAO|nr:AIPR family protein [Lutibacter flavus]SNR58837.1 AIPR protein [Lutibacter flavus]
MNRAYRNYVDEVKSEVAALVYSEGDGASFEDKYTEYGIEILDSIGKTDGARVLSFVHPNSRGGIDWKINGYCLRDSFKDDNSKSYFETLDMFITYYDSNSYDYNITSADFTKTLNQLKRFLNGAFKRHIDYIDKSNSELNELLKIIGGQSKLFDRVNVHFLLNGSYNQKNEKFNLKGLEDLNVTVQIWDIPRFFKINESNSTREPIEIEFSEFLDNNEKGIQCLKVPSIDDLYECYLSIIPGEVLASLYKEYSNELLESNVRAFLGQAGKFNKGIRDTIREKPQMFLPYNNGITATANHVETEIINKELIITKLNDFQIVNGGQTTASLYHTQKKYKDADLSNISVQMKLTVIKDIDKKNEEVPNIARYANSQNKVTELDLSSNNPYFVQVESLSRKKYVINPENRNQSLLWYFERVKGQYRESINKLTPSMQKKFKEQNPTKTKFVKSDIAKYINLWEQKPFMVARGAQKNFIDYTKGINELVKKNKLPGENFYKKLISNAIIFKTIDKLFGRKNVNAIGDTNLKSYTVAYTMSYFHFLTENRFDLWKLYDEQILNDKLINCFKNLLVFVYTHLTQNAVNTLISEYAKRETSWKKLKEEKYDLNFDILKEYLISSEEALARKKQKEVNVDDKIESNLYVISEIKKLGLKFWDGLKVYIKENPSKDIDYFRLLELIKKVKENRNLADRDISFGKKVLKFISNNEQFVTEIKNMSDLKEKEFVDIKAIYDRFKMADSETWKKALAIGEQTKIFSYQELSNIKYVQKCIMNNKQVREGSLLKCFESFKKVKKFGIKV